MRFGILTMPRDSEAFIERAQASERAGFDFLGVADTQCLIHELYTSLGAAARETADIQLGPSVTNPITRHLAVTASALCTLDAHSGGRAMMGLASGDSGVFTVGEQPASRDELRTFVKQFRALCRGDSVEHDGGEFDLTWLRQREDSLDIPVMLAAGGPKMLRLAGAVADRVLIGLGVTPEVVSAAVDQVDEGARTAGREPDDVEKWVYVRAGVTDDVADVRASLESAVAASTHHTLQATLTGKRVPEEHREAIKELVINYDSTQHMGLGDDATNRELMERLGLTEYLTKRFAIAGAPDVWVERIDQLRDLGTVDGVHLNPVHDDPMELITRMDERVFPEL